MIIKKNKNTNFLFFIIILLFILTLISFLFKDLQNLKNDIKIFLFQPDLNIKSFNAKENFTTITGTKLKLKQIEVKKVKYKPGDIDLIEAIFLEIVANEYSFSLQVEM